MKPVSFGAAQWVLLSVAFFLSSTTIPSLAQEPDINLAEASLEQLGRIPVYTASKHLQSGADAPSSVTVITSDEIERYGYRTLADILGSVRGFFVTYDRNYSSLGARGFARPGDYNTRILLLVDGHRLNNNIYDEAMLGSEFPVDVDLIDRVEIIRGPVSSLYGSNALFAVVNVFTKKGHDLQGLELSSEAGSFNTYQGRMSYGRKLRALEFLVSATYYGSRGQKRLYFPQFNTPQTNNGIAISADDDQIGSALATITFRDFTLQGLYGVREKGIPTGPYGTVFGDSRTRTTDAHQYLDLRYEHTFAQSWDLLARWFIDRSPYQGTYIYAGDSPARVRPNLDYGDGKWWGTELQLTMTVLKRNRITVGSEYRNSFRQDQIDYNVNPYELSLLDRRNSFSYAFFLQDEITISKALTVNAGLRYDYYNRTEASTDPRAAVIYRPRSSTALKYIYGEAFRVPNVYEMYYSIFPNFPNPALHPEKIRSNEAVWEQGITNHLWVTTSVFYNQMYGLITEEPFAGGGTIFRNLQDVRSAGAELELRGQVWHGLEGAASYSFQQTRDTGTDKLLSNSPRNLVKLRFSQPLLHRRMFVSLDAQYRSRIQSLASGTVSPFTVLNLNLLGRNLGKHLDLSLGVHNLLDKYYFDPPSSENLQLPIPQDGRSFRIKLTWHPGER
ncbi:MAG TPA: TonB-dependent receptor [Terriglobales bacterium]|nr:TonB-dependent receptor [Terriglobales bacterium]